MTLGQRVKQLRESIPMSQSDLAKAINVAPSYIGHIESDRRRPSRDIIKQLAGVLGTSVQDLLAAAGYLPPPRKPGEYAPEELPDFSIYVSRKFHGNKKLQKALISAYEAIRSIEEEQEEKRRRRRGETEE